MGAPAQATGPLVHQKHSKVTSAEKKAFLLRVDPALWAELERLASTELRSVNSQIEFMLREALERRGIRPKTSKKSRAG